MRIGKITAGLAVLILMGTRVLPVYAQEKKTELTIHIPSTYTLSIPMNQTISLNTATAEIGTAAITANLKSDEQVVVTVEKTAFEARNTEDTISYQLQSDGNQVSSLTWSEAEARKEKAKTYPLTVIIDETEWKQAHAGDYTATITFTAEVVS